MSQLVPVFLTIHILTAIFAFGPTLVFPLIARMSALEPQHGLFALRLTDKIERKIVIPAAATMPVSGGLLVWAENIDLASAHWLVLAIGLYLAAMAYALAVQLRTIDRMIEIAGQLASGGPMLATGPGAELARPGFGGMGSAQAVDAPASRYASPGAEMAALGARARNGGLFLLVLVIVIVSLMAGKPAI